jgi:uncharacterized protein YgiM (DUF1202 family)
LNLNRNILFSGGILAMSLSLIYKSRVFTLLTATFCLSCVFADQGSEGAFIASQEIQLSTHNEPKAHEHEIAQVSPPAPVKASSAKVPELPVAAFTGKVKGKKVRLRLKADVDSQVISELNKNDLLTVVGEKGDFWAVQPPAGIKAYVFRSFILDNVVEGKHVNVRLEPSTDAPIIGHLNTGDKIQGTLCAANNKWLEIAPPAQTRFYIAKEYLQNIGGPEVKAQADKRHQTVEQLLESAATLGKAELRKAYDEMDIDRVLHTYKTVVNEYTDFPEFVEKAKEQQIALQEAYVQKRLAHLETKSSVKEEKSSSKKHETASVEVNATDKMKMWEPIEEALYLSWSNMHDDKTLEQFYDEQALSAVPLTGILEAYSSPVKNKPGDFIIRDKDLPIAYVYSTKINLQHLVGKKVTLLGAPRSNNNFAFPAYFVIGQE